ncbi:MAG: hypothetical protein FWH10_06105 [Oscillospiraceae bacterium]|nr:hypothetical protein [Oscillospiraceae bacterium]
MPNKLNIINIGQILFICLLLAVIFTQTSGIISNPGLAADSGESGKDGYIRDIQPGITGQNAPGVPERKPEASGEPEKLPGINAGALTDFPAPEAIFILGEENGRLAVLGPDGESVYEIFDVYISTLPEYDRELLQTGIKITTAEELRSLLEDYTS